MSLQLFAIASYKLFLSGCLSLAVISIINSLCKRSPRSTQPSIPPGMNAVLNGQNRNLPARNTLIQLLALYTDAESLNTLQTLQSTERRTDGRTDDVMMPIAVHTVSKYDRLKSYTMSLHTSVIPLKVLLPASSHYGVVWVSWP